MIKEKFYTDLIAQTTAGQALSLQYQYDKNTVAVKGDTLTQLIAATSNTNLSTAATIAAKTLVGAEAITLASLVTAINTAGVGQSLLNFTLGANMVITGTSGADTYTNTVKDRVYLAGAGNDNLTGNIQGAYFGEGGNDTLTLNSAASGVLSGGDGADIFHNYAKNAVVDGGTGNDTITGYNGSDAIYQGGDGDDTIATAGSGSITGGAESKAFLLAA